MKKIGILTFHTTKNPGTFLQAFATLRILKKKFPDHHVEIIDYNHRKKSFELKIYHLDFRKLLRDYKIHQTYCKFQNRYFNKSDVSFGFQRNGYVKKYLEDLNYDMIMVGSDTVLRLDIYHFQHKKAPIFWLPGDLKCKKIMIAASSDILCYSDLDGDIRKILESSINHFDFIGIRDQMTHDLIQKLRTHSTTTVTIIPDPTFTLPIDYAHIEAYIKQKKIDFSIPTIGVSLPNRFSLTEKLIRHYRAKGFQVISLNDNRSANYRFNGLTPFQWSGIYRYFKIMITDRFHGTIFSLRNNTPVISIDLEKGRFNNKGQSKTYDLLYKFNMHKTNHLNLNDIKSVEKIIQKVDTAMKKFKSDSVKKNCDRQNLDYCNFIDRVSRELN